MTWQTRPGAVTAKADRCKALAWAVAEASVEEIDTINILHASMLAMAQRAVDALSVRPIRID